MMEWIQITDPDGKHDKRQKALFEQSKEIYEAAFEPDLQEDWANFKKYILLKRKNVQGCYFVGLDDGQVEGMAHLAIYNKFRLGILPYYGIRDFNIDSNQRLEMGKCFWVALDKKLHSDKINYVLLEAGKYDDPTVIMGPERRFQCQNVVDHYQKHGAQKIPLINYMQPVLEIDAIDHTPPFPLHLMFRQTPGAKLKTSSVEVKMIRNWVNFIYNVFYLDGFKFSNRKRMDGPETLAKVKEHLQDLYQKAISDLPTITNNIPVYPINFSQHSIAFISFTCKDSDSKQIVRILRGCLADRGIKVIDMVANDKDGVDRPLSEVEQGWIKESDLTIFLLTDNAFNSKGMLREMKFAAKEKRKCLPILFLSDNQKEHDAMEKFNAFYEDAKPIHLDTTEFHTTIDACINAIKGC